MGYQISSLVDATNEFLARLDAAPVTRGSMLLTALEQTRRTPAEIREDRTALAVSFQKDIETLKNEGADPALIEVAKKAADLARKTAAGGGRAAIARKEAALIAALKSARDTGPK